MEQEKEQCVFLYKGEFCILCSDNDVLAYCFKGPSSDEILVKLHNSPP